MVRVGCVPYVNALPLVAWFESLGDQSPVQLIYEVPSRLPALLESGAADAIMVSSVDALMTPGRRIAEGVCIGSHGPVKSVRVLSKVPPAEIRSLAWDQSSMTSNRLAEIVLSQGYGAKFDSITLPPDQKLMLERCDACVLIGDIGMLADGTGLFDLDLGEEWRKLTGKPFVWAGWIGNERLTPDLVLFLQTAAALSTAGKQPPAIFSERFILRRWFEEAAGVFLPHFEKLLDFAQEKSGWTREMLEDYYHRVIVYELSGQMLDGLREFQSRLLAQGYAECRHFPEIVCGALTESSLTNFASPI